MTTNLQVMRWPSLCREVIAIVAAYHFDINIDFKQCMIAMDGYAATNP